MFVSFKSHLRSPLIFHSLCIRSQTRKKKEIDRSLSLVVSVSLFEKSGIRDWFVLRPRWMWAMKYEYRRQIRENTRYEYSTEAQSGPTAHADASESRWKRYIQILIASTETRVLYGSVGKDNLRVYEKTHVSFLTVIIDFPVARQSLLVMSEIRRNLRQFWREVNFITVHSQMHVLT